jgi:acyl carrier protein
MIMGYLDKYSKQEINDKVLELLSHCLGTGKDHIDTEASIEKDLGADSLDVVETIIEIEKEFDIIITEEMEAGIGTVKDLITCVEERLSIDSRIKEVQVS